LGDDGLGESKRVETQGMEVWKPRRDDTRFRGIGLLKRGLVRFQSNNCGLKGESMTFASEADLCLKFGEWARAHGYETDNECLGWDMMLVDQCDRRLGIQAKLKDDRVAVAQCLEGMKEPTANAAAILMPYASESLRRLCKAAGIGVATPISEDAMGFVSFGLTIPKTPFFDSVATLKPMPPGKNETPAGVKSPRKFTAWTEKELRLEVLFHRRGGWCNTKDFKRVGLDPRRFLPGWLCRTRANHFEQVIASELPSLHHPKNFARIEKEMESVHA
jgi:hypothetical protein